MENILPVIIKNRSDYRIIDKYPSESISTQSKCHYRNISRNKTTQPLAIQIISYTYRVHLSNASIKSI